MNIDLSQSFQLSPVDYLNDMPAVELATKFDTNELAQLLNYLRTLLWQQKILPDRLKELETYQLPIEVLGISHTVQGHLKSRNIKTVHEFIWRDTPEKLTDNWPDRERLAVRIRIFWLLLLPSAKLTALKSQASRNNNISPTVSTAPVQPTIPSKTRDAGEAVVGFQDQPFLHKWWFLDGVPADFVSPSPAIERFMFEDVYRLPIVTSRRHEIWAGVQMNASRGLGEIIEQSASKSPRKIFAIVYSQLLLRWETLEHLCQGAQISTPNAAIWVNEILSVRSNFFKTPRSRFRSFLKSVDKLGLQDDKKNHITDTACSAFELFWMLPTATLKYIRQETGDQRQLPSQGLLDDQLKSLLRPQHSLNLRLSQGQKARHILISGYFRAVLRFCRNLAEKEDAADFFMDLVQEGVIGLITAADKYDYRKGGRFITYATSWIWQSTGRNLPDLTRNIRVPVHYHEQLKKLEPAYINCLENEGVTPSPEVLCLYLDLLQADEIAQIRSHIADGEELTAQLKKKWARATKKTSLLLRNIEPTISLEVDIPFEMISEVISDDIQSGSTQLKEVVPDINENSDAYDVLITLNDLQQTLNNFLSAFSERNQKMIDLRFGLTDGDERTLEEIGNDFGLTRERVRQITAKAIENLSQPTRKRRLEQYLTLFDNPPDEPMLSQNVSSFLAKNHSYWAKLHQTGQENGSDEYWQWLDRLIERLPGSDWHDRKGVSSRRMQLEDALQILGAPTHYTDITEQLNDMIGEELDDGYVYTLLNKYENTFILLGEGVFSRVEWELARRGEQHPQLPFCPAPVPDLPGQTDTLFESILVATGRLKQPTRTSKFLERMLEWSQSNTEQSNWYRQSMLNSYYLVGLIPYTFHFISGADPLLKNVYPASNDLQFLRRYSLIQLTERLAAMPQFWWILRRYQPGRITDFAEPFVEIHPLGLDDVANRLKLLAGLGAVKRLSYGKYQLSSFGEEMAARLMQQPTFDEIVDEDEIQESIEEFDLFGLGLW